MKPITVFLVDDHRLVREGLRSILDPDPDFTVVGEAFTAQGALEGIAEHNPDVAVLDLRLPDMDGMQLCSLISQERPDTAILILTAFLDANLVNSCFKSGAKGYLIKDAEDLNLKQHIRTVHQGYAALDPRVASILADQVRKGRPDTLLKPRELEALRLIAQGMTNREVAETLNLSEYTIKDYVKGALAKLGAHNRVEAIMRARERGLL